LEKEQQEKFESYAYNYVASEDFDYVISVYDIKEILPNLCGKVFLILGESAGNITQLLYQRANKIDIVEASLLAINRTNSRLQDKKKIISYYQSLWLEFTTATKYTDIIFIRGLEHEPNSIELLNRLRNNLAENGKLHIIVPNAYSLHRRLLLLRKKISSIHALRQRDLEIGHVKFYDKNILTHELAQSGYNIDFCHGFFLKPFQNSSMKKFSMNRKNLLYKALYYLGKIFPNWGTQLYCLASQNKNYRTSID